MSSLPYPIASDNYCTDNPFSYCNRFILSATTWFINGGDVWRYALDCLTKTPSDTVPGLNSQELMRQCRRRRLPYCVYVAEHSYRMPESKGAWHEREERYSKQHISPYTLDTKRLISMSRGFCPLHTHNNLTLSRSIYELKFHEN